MPRENTYFFTFEIHFILIVVHFEVDRLSNSTTEHIENTLDLINALKKLSSRTIK